MGVLGAALGGVASLAGDIFGANSARSQQKFEERMADTTYQRTVADMKRAGLNPMMMMAKGGGTDPVPSGTGVEQGKLVASAADKAANMALLEAQIEAQRANAQQTRAQTLALLPAQVQQIQELTKNAVLTGRTILPMASSAMELQSVQEELGRAQAGRIRTLLPADLAAAELQPALVSAQTKAALENAQRTGYGELGRFIGPDFLNGLARAWRDITRGMFTSSAQSGESTSK